MKPKQAQPAESGARFDQCWTPPHAVAPLLPYLSPRARVWEPAAGAGWLADALEADGHSTIRSDYSTGQDFFRYELDPERYDVIVTNPPYSLKYKWLKRCYATGKPFALLIPFESLASGTALTMYREHGWEELRLMQRINFYMPNKGYEGAGAQFPVVWLCYKLLPAPIIVADVPKPAPEHQTKRPKKALRIATDNQQHSLLEAA